MNNLLLRRRMMMQAGGSPTPYDAEVEYIMAAHNTGFDLGFKPTDNVQFKIGFQRDNNNIRFDCGAEADWSSKIVRLLFLENSKLYYRYGNSSVPNVEDDSSNFVGDIVCDFNANSGIIENITTSYQKNITSNGNRPFICPDNFGLISMGYNGGQSVGDTTKYIKLKWAQVKDTSLGVDLDLIPVRIGSVAYLFDKNSNNFYPNVSQFNAYFGADVVRYRHPSYVPIEYIESDSSQFIDTMIFPSYYYNNSVEIILDCEYLDITTRQLNGAGDGYYFGVNNGKWELKHNRYVGTADNNRHILKLYISKNSNSRLLSVDNTVYTDNTNWYGENTIKFGGLGLFGIYDNTFSPSQPILCSMKLYNSQIKVDDVLVANMLPARVGSTGCLYDTIRDFLLYDSNGGNPFILGNDI